MLFKDILVIYFVNMIKRIKIFNQIVTYKQQLSTFKLQLITLRTYHLNSLIVVFACVTSFSYLRIWSVHDFIT